MIVSLHGLVAGKKRRYQQGGYDLDLAYVTDHLIAMSYPFEGLQEWFRNPLSRVRNLLESKHKGHYMLFNLCSERSYPSSKFGSGTQVACFPFEDHQAPPLPLISDFCRQVAVWLQKDPENIAVVHCKAGKGRTGTMICSYLIHAGICKTAQEALDLYSAKRTLDGNGVTNPSQRRYVQYYADWLQQPNLLPRRLQLQRVTVTGIPLSDLRNLVVGVWVRPPGAGWKTELVCLAAVKPEAQYLAGIEPCSHPGTITSTNGKVDDNLRQTLHQRNQPLLLGNDSVTLECNKLGPEDCWVVQGDVKIEVFKGAAKQKSSLAWTWLSTMFAPKQQTLSVTDLDHSQSLAAGSLTPWMYVVWTKWLRMAHTAHEGMQLCVEFADLNGSRH
ncbi:hypothetical protein ABBQ32_000513 [Trebouxia sp. C0010 RCD-2024]